MLFVCQIRDTKSLQQSSKLKKHNARNRDNTQKKKKNTSSKTRKQKERENDDTIKLKRNKQRQTKKIKQKNKQTVQINDCNIKSIIFFDCFSVPLFFCI